VIGFDATLRPPLSVDAASAWKFSAAAGRIAKGKAIANFV